MRDANISCFAYLQSAWHGFVSVYSYAAAAVDSIIVATNVIINARSVRNSSTGVVNLVKKYKSC